MSIVEMKMFGMEKIEDTYLGLPIDRLRVFEQKCAKNLGVQWHELVESNRRLKNGCNSLGDIDLYSYQQYHFILSKLEDCR